MAVLNLRHLLLLGILVGFAVCCSISFGQEADADQAKALLQQGIALYNTLDFTGAKATLLKINPADLSDADKKVLDEYVTLKLEPAIKEQRAAMEAYKLAGEALETGNLEEARTGFATAANSDRLPTVIRLDAQAQLAIVSKKIELAQAAATDVNKQPETSATMEAEPEPQSETQPQVITSVIPWQEAETKPFEAVPGDETPIPLVEIANGAPDSKADKMLEDLDARRNKIDQLLNMGRKALGNRQPEQAAGYFRRVLALDPDNVEAKQQLSYTRQLPAAVGEVSVLTRMERNRRISRQAADLDFEKAIKLSEEALEKADSAAGFNSAVDTAQTARNVLLTNKSLYSEREYNERLIRVENQIESVRVKREDWQRQRVIQQLTEVEEQERRRVVRETQRRQRKIAALSARIKALQSERKFAEALEVARQIVKLDPTDQRAAGWVEALSQFVLIQEDKDIRQDQRMEEKRQLIEVRRSEIPWYELVKYPKDWQEVTLRREPFTAERGVESPADRKLRQLLDERLAV
ncbi:MAG: hypothetical protein ACYSTL_02710, partial [Planctomycetota bacterium]